MGKCLYTLEQLKKNKELWKELDIIPIQCSYCHEEFEIKYGTLYNIIRRSAEGIYCSRKCVTSSKVKLTQEKFKKAGGKKCKRCEEFKELDNFSSLPNPPYFRAECKRCHNYKPARQFGALKEKAKRLNIKFELSLDQYLDNKKNNCYYCSNFLKNIRLETLDLEKGYVIGNIISCCSICCKFKEILGHNEFIELCHKISNNLKKMENK